MMAKHDSVTIDAVLTGTPKPLARGELSCIDKIPISVPVLADIAGLAGDMQADRRVHGGPDKAILYYPAEHYPDWRAALPLLAPRLKPGGFGENLSGCGLTEHSVLIGDLWRAGAALLQICQGRQPCWKLNARFGCDDMLDHVLANGRGGWYCRVVEPGLIAAGDAMQLVDRPVHGWTVARVTAAILAKQAPREAFAEIAVLPGLAAGWRDRAIKRQ